MKQQQISLSHQRKLDQLSLIKEYFLKERDEQLGDLGAELIYNFFIKNFAPSIYDQAIDDLKKMLKERFFYLETDLDALKKNTNFVDSSI